MKKEIFSRNETTKSVWSLEIVRIPLYHSLVFMPIEFRPPKATSFQPAKIKNLRF